MKKASYLTIIVITLAILTSNCEDRSWDNPFGGDLNPEDWATNFTDSIQQAKINEAVLTWKAVNKNIDGYIIRRNINDKGEIVEPFIIKRAGNTDTSYIDEQLIPDPNLHYNYQISAYAGANESLVNDTSITPSFPAPSNFKYSILDKDLASINISWNDNSNGEDGFSIYRKYSGYDWVKILQTNEDVTAFVDHVPQSTNIQYKIEGFKSKCTSTSLYGELNIAGSKSLIFGGNKNDELNAICRTPNLTYVAVGSTTSTDFAITNEDPQFLNSQNALLVEFDHNLNIRRTLCFGGSGQDYFKKIFVVDNGYLLLGYTESNDYDCQKNTNNHNNWILKLDADLNFIDDAAYFFPNTVNDIKVLQNGTVVLCGETEDKAWLKLLYNNGSTIENTFEGKRFKRILALPSNDFLITGITTSNKAWLLKYNDQGNLIWDKTYTTNGDIIGNDIGVIKSFNTAPDELKNEEYIVLPTYNSISNKDEVFIYIIDLDGNLVKEISHTIANGSQTQERVAMIIKDDYLIFYGSNEPFNSFIMKSTFKAMDTSISLNWYEDNASNTKNFNFHSINQVTASFNGNCLFVGKVFKSIEVADYDDDCWIGELNIQNGKLAE